ncbi:hypothetical protein P4O66_018881, partial [Electrophorus voltai]
MSEEDSPDTAGSSSQEPQKPPEDKARVWPEIRQMSSTLKPPPHRPEIRQMSSTLKPPPHRSEIRQMSSTLETPPHRPEIRQMSSILETAPHRSEIRQKNSLLHPLHLRSDRGSSHCRRHCTGCEMGSMAWDCGLRYLFSLPPALQQSGVCALRAPDDLSRLEMVQRLAKDGCRFFQSQNYRLPDRSAQTQGEGVVRVCLKERGQDVLVLQRVASDRMSPQTAGGVREDDGDRSGAVCVWSWSDARGELLLPVAQVRAWGLGHDGVSQEGLSGGTRMGSVRQHRLDLRAVTLVEEEEDDDDNDSSECHSGSSRDAAAGAAFNIPHFRYIDDNEEDEDDDDDDDVLSSREWSSSSYSVCSTEREYTSDSSPSAVSNRYVVVSGTPHKILEHLLSDLRLDEHQGATESKEAETLLDDFLLTYLVFMSTHDLCQALLGQYPLKIRNSCSRRSNCLAVQNRCRGKEEGKEALYRKRKVLHLVSQWSSLYKDSLREEEHVKLFMKKQPLRTVPGPVRQTQSQTFSDAADAIKLFSDQCERCTLIHDLYSLNLPPQTLYRYVLEDVYEFPTLEKDLKEFQKLLRRRHTVDEYSPHQKSKALFQQLSLKENGVQQRGAQADIREVMCRVYVSSDSYLSMRVRSTVVAQDLLHTVAQRMDKLEEDMVLVAQTYSGEKRLLQPHDSIFSESLALPGRLIACWKDLSEVLPPLTDCAELLQRPARLLAINTWDVAVALTALDWSLFNSVHEQELVYYTFSRQASSGHTVALEQLLQRCNEVQQWVMSEVLLCASLGKRVQLLKKFIKIAAHCKAQRNLNSSFAIIMGLNTAAVSRLNQTWEKVPGKFKKLFSELELLTDPSLNHKAYRDAFRKMKSPKIPFMPLLLKDITFIHEGNKTFHDNLVNFEKL